MNRCQWDKRKTGRPTKPTKQKKQKQKLLPIARYAAPVWLDELLGAEPMRVRRFGDAQVFQNAEGLESFNSLALIVAWMKRSGIREIGSVIDMDTERQAPDSASLHPGYDLMSGSSHNGIMSKAVPTGKLSA